MIEPARPVVCSRWREPRGYREHLRGAGGEGEEGVEVAGGGGLPAEARASKAGGGEERGERRHLHGGEVADHLHGEEVVEGLSRGTPLSRPPCLGSTSLGKR